MKITLKIKKDQYKIIDTPDFGNCNCENCGKNVFKITKKGKIRLLEREGEDLIYHNCNLKMVTN